MIEIRRLNKELVAVLNELEERIQLRTKELEIEKNRFAESNIALKVLMNHREQEKKNVEKTVLFNVRKLITPYLEKLRQHSLKRRQKIYLEIIDKNLQEIIKPFAPTFSEQLQLLTPAEITVANLTEQGKTAKEIADLLSLSPATIATHKQNIRKKLGLSNKKINLRTILSSEK